MLKLIALALIPFALVAGNAAAGKGGPTPGVSTGWDGAVDVANAVRYVALPTATTTIVAVVRTRDGRVLRLSTIRGAFGIPFVAFDGTTEGISATARRSCSRICDKPSETRFAVLTTASLRLEAGDHASRPLGLRRPSPNGRTLVRDPVFRHRANARYDVRSVSLVTGKPVGGALVDRREPTRR